MWEVARLFARLGFTAFGGPAAHVGMIEAEVVGRRGWIDRRHFLDLVGLVNFIPGPNSTELAIHLGLLRAGWRGLVAAGVCFITPAVLIILPLAGAYVRFGRRADFPQLQAALGGIGAAVVAVIAAAGWRLATTALRDRFSVALAAATVAGEYALARWVPAAWGVQPELVLLAAAALAGVLWYAPPRADSLAPLPALGLPLVPAVAGAAAGPPWDELLRMAGFFLKIGATLFGSGYVLVSYLQSGLVDAPGGWLTKQQLLDAVAVGQVTPGPLLTTATFLGYIRGHQLFGTIAGGVLGGVVATAAIFLPAFVLVALFGRVLPKIRGNPHARAALAGINAAVVAMVFTVAARFAWDLRGDPLRVGIAAACLVALVRWNVNATWLLAGAAVAGWAGYGLGIR